MKIAAGTRLGRYEIRSKIGEGGMGEVYLAQDTQLRRRVALKVLPAEVSSSSNRMRRFKQEATAAAALNHPNISTIYEIGESQGTHFIAMELIEGVTLSEVIRQQRGLPKLLRYLQDVIQGLAKAHAAGIVHRDLKPDNIMVTRDGHPKILDFGLAKLIEPQPPASASNERLSATPTAMMQHSQPGTVLGTVGYMSPEQAQGRVNEIDHRSDIFSFGCILFEAATRRRPFEGKDALDSLHKIVHAPTPQIMDLNPDAPRELQRIVRRCLAKDPEERYQSIKDVGLELKEVRELLGAAITDTTMPPTTSAPAAPTGTRESTAANLVLGIRRHKTVLALVALVVIVGAIVLIASRRAPTGPTIDSIAVLPLTNAGNDANTEYLSDGISEALINSLTELQQLRVIARTTAFRYRGREADPQIVGRELNVRAVLTGRVRQFGDSLNIQVDLLDATTGAQLWGQEYERKASDLLSIKQSIANEVVDKLKLRLSSADQQKLAKRDTQNGEAYQFYLRGRYFQGRRTAESLQKAIGEFQQAIDLDPNYALGYVGLADSYSLLEQSAGTPANEVRPKARGAADRALQIDDSLAEGHTSSAKIYEQSWRWSEAENEYRRAISLNPNYAIAHQWLALYLRTRLRFDEAMAEIKRARELDPLSPLMNANAAFAYFLKGDFDAAIAQDQKVLELDPTFWIAHTDMGWAYLKQKRYDEAAAAFQKAVDSSGRASIPLGHLAYCYAQTGKRNEAVALAKELEGRYARHEALGFSVATVYAGLGDKDRAFVWLEKDFQQSSGQLPFIVWWPNFDTFRDDPRFADLVHRMGLTL